MTLKFVSYCSVSIQLFIADQTGKPLPAAEALALVETKNAIAIMAEKYGYNISSISAVSPVTLEGELLPHQFLF